MSYIGSVIGCSEEAPATTDIAGFQAVASYTEISRVVSATPIGDTYEDLTVTLLKEGRVDHSNGAADGGNITITLDGDDLTDAGRVIIEDNNGGNNNVSFEIVGEDTTLYLFGKVRSLITRNFDASTKSGFTFDIAVNSPVFRTPTTP